MPKGVYQRRESELIRLKNLCEDNASKSKGIKRPYHSGINHPNFDGRYSAKIRKKYRDRKNKNIKIDLEFQEKESSKFNKRVYKNYLKKVNRDNNYD